MSNDRLTIPEVAEQLGIGEDVVAQLIASGKLANSGTKNMVRVSWNDLYAFNAQNDVQDMAAQTGEQGVTEDSIEEDDSDDNDGGQAIDDHSDDDDEAIDDSGEDSGPEDVADGDSDGGDRFGDSTRVRPGDGETAGSGRSRERQVLRDSDGEDSEAGSGRGPIAALTAMVKGLQTEIGKLREDKNKDTFAPDDKDLRDQAEADATALVSADGMQISPLGRDGKKGKASEMLVNAMFDTPREKLDEMTNISGDLEALAFAGVRTFNQFVGKAFSRQAGDPIILLSDVFLDNAEKLKRSVGGAHLMRAMAMSSIERDKDEARENSVVFGGMGSTDY